MFRNTLLLLLLLCNSASAQWNCADGRCDFGFGARVYWPQPSYCPPPQRYNPQPVPDTYYQEQRGTPVPSLGTPLVERDFVRLKDYNKDVDAWNENQAELLSRLDKLSKELSSLKAQGCKCASAPTLPTKEYVPLADYNQAMTTWNDNIADFSESLKSIQQELNLLKNKKSSPQEELNRSIISQQKEIRSILVQLQSDVNTLKKMKTPSTDKGLSTSPDPLYFTIEEGQPSPTKGR